MGAPPPSAAGTGGGLGAALGGARRPVSCSWGGGSSPRTKADELAKAAAVAGRGGAGREGAPNAGGVARRTEVQARPPRGAWGRADIAATALVARGVRWAPV